MDPSKNHARALLGIALLSLTLVAPSRLHVFDWSEGKVLRVKGYPHAKPLSALSSADLDQDGYLEQIILLDGGLEIRRHGVTLWASPSDWQVTQAQITDINHDQIAEITLLVWREFRPWPIDAYLPHPGRIQGFHDQHNRSCHLILIGWQRGAYRELWAGSALADPILGFTAADLDQDGRQELATLETKYDSLSPLGQAIALWEWNGFGFSLRSRAQGHFYMITTIQTYDGQELLLTQGNLRR